MHSELSQAHLWLTYYCWANRCSKAKLVVSSSKATLSNPPSGHLLSKPSIKTEDKFPQSPCKWGVQKTPEDLCTGVHTALDLGNSNTWLDNDRLQWDCATANSHVPPISSCDCRKVSEHMQNAHFFHLRIFDRTFTPSPPPFFPAPYMEHLWPWDMKALLKSP